MASIRVYFYPTQFGTVDQRVLGSVLVQAPTLVTSFSPVQALAESFNLVESMIDDVARGGQIRVLGQEGPGQISEKLPAAALGNGSSE